MGIYSEKAANNFKSGYNCAQAVFLAFAEDFGLDKETALKLSSSFGGGMGRLREVCGAVSSMFAIAGLKHGYTSPNDDEAKAKHYELIQSLAEKFKSKYGTIEELDAQAKINAAEINRLKTEIIKLKK